MLELIGLILGGWVSAVAVGQIASAANAMAAAEAQRRMQEDLADARSRQAPLRWSDLPEGEYDVTIDGHRYRGLNTRSWHRDHPQGSFVEHVVEQRRASAEKANVSH